MFTRVTQGMRQLEQFNLRWEHVNFDRGVLTLPTTKAGGVQYVRLNEEAIVLLRRLNSWTFYVWVFPSQNPATHAGPTKLLSKALLSDGKGAGFDKRELAHAQTYFPVDWQWQA